MNLSKVSLGIEFGSTRIKAMLIDEQYQPLATGSYDWENSFIDGVWTYSLKNVWTGLQSCYAALKAQVKEKYGVTITTLGSIGISAMMHGYLAFDEAGDLLVPFRTWRNTITAEAAEKLTALFDFNIPQRWSIAHLYQAMLNGEPHVARIRQMTTLSGYIHFMLTEQKVLGIGDASGMFPIDSGIKDYDRTMVAQFDELLKKNELPYTLNTILPKVLSAGQDAGELTRQGALLLDPEGDLQNGIPLCPPEGDAGTGMVATNSIREMTGNVSAGTSIFAMIVLQKPLSKLYTEIDMVTTPDGKPVAMAHCNNCTSDLNAWADMLGKFVESFGVQATRGKILDQMFALGAKGSTDCGGVLSYNYFSGEPVTQLDEGRALLVRTSDAVFSVENLMRSHLYSAVATLKIGMDILVQDEKMEIKSLLGHGGYFKAENVGQRIMAAAMNTKVSVMKTASEGGAYGMALLAAYLHHNESSLDDFLSQGAFRNCEITTVTPEPEEVKGFEVFMKQYKAGLAIERTATEALQ